MKMKSYSYLFQSLLFLLLITVKTTVSAGFPRRLPPSVKNIGRDIKGIAKNYKWLKKIDNIVNDLSPSQDLQQGIKIQGLSVIKQFLYDFGYIEKQSGSFDDTLDTKTISAINAYQKNFNLKVTSDLNNETLRQISLPRCGVPDMNYEYAFTDTVNASWPKGNKWFPKDKKNLTYSFAPQSQIPLNATKVLRNALTRWSTTTKVINFTEARSYDDADIKIGFYNYGEGVEDVVVGDTFISLQLNSGVKSAVIQLDASKYWILPTYNHTWSWQDGEFDLETVVMHQIGHLLGLDHSFEEDSIMYPTILPSQQRKVQITVSDNETIHQLYTNATKADANYGYVGSSSGLITSLFLGFAFMAMLN